MNSKDNDQPQYMGSHDDTYYPFANSGQYNPYKDNMDNDFGANTKSEDGDSNGRYKYRMDLDGRGFRSGCC
jgi:hypothetical protein